MEVKLTYKQHLFRIADSNTSNQKDEDIIWYILNEVIGLKGVRITCGMVYVRGTFPKDIHSTAKQIIETFNLKQ